MPINKVGSCGGEAALVEGKGVRTGSHGAGGCITLWKGGADAREEGYRGWGGRDRRVGSGWIEERRIPAGEGYREPGGRCRDHPLSLPLCCF